MKIVITNIVSLNPGDAAILQGTLEILRRTYGAGVDVVVFDKDGTAAMRYYPWARFRPALFAQRERGVLMRMARRRGYAHRVLRWDAWRYRTAGRLLQRGQGRIAALLLDAEELKGVAEYASADLVISSGGTYLVPHYDLQVPVLDYELTLELGRPLVFFPQSLGPFEEGLRLRDRLVSVFNRATRVIVRDERSAQNLRNAGVVPDRVTVSPDAAFALATEPVPAAVRGSGPPRIAVSVREWRHGTGEAAGAARERRYDEAMAAAVTRLVREHNADVTFVSTCQGIPEYWTDDSVVARRITALLDGDVLARTSVDGQFRQPLDVVRELASYHGIIATRMHAAILGLCAGVPVLPVAYEFKTRELFRSFGMEEWVTDYGTPEPGEFAALAARFAGCLDLLRDRIGAAIGSRTEAVHGIGDLLPREAP